MRIAEIERSRAAIIIRTVKLHGFVGTTGGRSSLRCDVDISSSDLAPGEHFHTRRRTPSLSSEDAVAI